MKDRQTQEHAQPLLKVFLGISFLFGLYIDAQPFSSDGLLKWYSYKAAMKQTKLKCCPFFLPQGISFF